MPPTPLTNALMCAAALTTLLCGTDGRSLWANDFTFKHNIMWVPQQFRSEKWARFYNPVTTPAELENCTIDYNLYFGASQSSLPGGNVSAWRRSSSRSQHDQHSLFDVDPLVTVADADNNGVLNISIDPASPALQIGFRQWDWSQVGPRQRDAGGRMMVGKSDDGSIGSVAQLVPYFNQTIIFVEAENLTAAAGGWEAREWSTTPNLFASNVNNVFHSRRAYLHAAAATVVGSAATAVLPVPNTGTYSVLLRYECAYRFQTPVEISITQNGAEVFRHVYGRLSSLKVWPAGEQNNFNSTELLKMVVPISGATENMVWEGVGRNVSLESGPAVLTLRAVREPGVPLSMHADRNMDVIMLHPNASDIQMRLSSGKDRPCPRPPGADKRP